MQVPLNIRLLLQHPNINVNVTNECEITALLACMIYVDGERSLLCARQLFNHADINVNHVKGECVTAYDVTVDHEEFLMHAILTHGRI
jgi:hypothetical protein